jgi:DNA-binding beta-propeller fold protein YncE
MKTRLLSLVLLLTSACATAWKGPEVVWPTAPETARIKFVDSWVSIEDIDRSGWGVFKRSLMGTRGEVRFFQPMGIAVSRDGQRVYVADYAGVQLVKVDLTAHTMARFASQVGFGPLFGVALDDDENVYVTDSSQKAVLVLDQGGNLKRMVGLGELERPTGLAIDGKRQLLYVADSASVASQKHRVLVYSLAGKKLRQLGQERGTAPGQYNFPTYLAVDGSGDVMVSDSMNFRLQRFSADGELLRVFGEPGDAQGTFSRMKGIGFDGFGNAYVVDSGHAVVQLFNREMQLLMWFGGRVGKLEYLELPSAVAIDRAHNRIYVAEQGAIPRINVYDLINTTEKDSLEPDAPKGGDAAPRPAP